MTVDYVSSLLKQERFNYHQCAQVIGLWLTPHPYKNICLEKQEILRNYQEIEINCPVKFLSCNKIHINLLNKSMYWVLE